MYPESPGGEIPGQQLIWIQLPGCMEDIMKDLPVPSPAQAFMTDQINKSMDL